MSEKSAYEQKAEAKIEEMDAEIQRLRAKAKEQNADARLESENAIDRLKARRDDVAARLEETKSSSGEAWRDVKAGLDRAMDDMRGAFRSARERFS